MAAADVRRRSLGGWGSCDAAAAAPPDPRGSLAATVLSAARPEWTIRADAAESSAAPPPAELLGDSVRPPPPPRAADGARAGDDGAALPGGFAPARVAPGGMPAADGADNAEVLQSKAESIVARLDDVEELKRRNPFTGESFGDLISRLALGRELKVYQKNVPGDRLVQGTVSEQILAVVDCEKERHLLQLRDARTELENKLRDQEQAHREDMARLRGDLLRHRQDTEKEFEEHLGKNRRHLKETTEQLINSGMRSQLDSAKTKDELQLVGDDAAALRKLLFFWKKKNEVLKRAFDVIERELLLAREKLRDFHHIHRTDAHKVHRFCGRLREQEMLNKQRIQKLEVQVAERENEAAHLRHDLGRPEDGGADGMGSPGDFGGDGGYDEDGDRDGDIPAPAGPPDPADPGLWHRLTDDTARMHADLASRCRVLLGLPGAGSPGRSASPKRRPGVLASGDEALAAELSLLRDGVRLRDDAMRVLLAALRQRDHRVVDLRGIADTRERRIYELETKVFEPFHLEELVKEKADLQRVEMQAKAQINALHAQLDEERRGMAAERERQQEAEQREAKHRREREVEQEQRLRDRDTELIRLRCKMHQMGGCAAGPELRIIKLTQETLGLRDQIVSLEDEKTRLKHYVVTLGKRLEQARRQLEQADTRVRVVQGLGRRVASPLSSQQPTPPTAARSRSPFRALSQLQQPRQSRSPPLRPVSPPALGF